MEDVHLNDARVDFVTARALGIDKDFFNWSRNALNPTGSLVFMARRRRCQSNLQDAGWNWSHPIRIPQSERRFILRGSKT